MQPTSPRAPTILIANGDEWSIRSLETVLDPVGYVVVRAFDLEQALDAALHTRPDAVLLDIDLSGRSGVDLCRMLRSQPEIRSNTPLLVTTIDTITHATRVAALKAGAWAVLRLPVDPEELVLRLGTLIGAKRDAEHARGLIR